MKPKTMILMGLAITCGLGASYMTSRLLAERSVPDEPEKVEILVASKNLSVHQRIVNPEDLFEKKTVAKENEPADAIKDFEALRGKTMKTGRMKGDHVTAANLYDRGALEIPHGYQAVGVRVNIETTASGLASLPGSRVNLLLSIGSQNLAATKTFVLLEHVLVLAADIRVTPEGEIAAPAQVVTFALKDEDILRVTTAKKMGEITLVLRNKDDHSTAVVREMEGKKILDANKSGEPPPQIVVEAPKPKEVPKAVEPEQPKVIHSHYDVVNGSESGSRTVTRVFYSQTEDGTITVTDTRVIDSTRSTQGSTASPNKGGRPQDF
jgi:Flp pilus assembly protein CpaB